MTNKQLYYVLAENNGAYQLDNQGHYASAPNAYSKIVMDKDGWLTCENMRTGRGIWFQHPTNGLQYVCCMVDGQKRYMNRAWAAEKIDLDNFVYYGQGSVEQPWYIANGFEIITDGNGYNWANLEGKGLMLQYTFPSNTWTIEFEFMMPVSTTVPNPLVGYFYLVDLDNHLAFLTQDSQYWGDLQGNYNTSYQSGFYNSPTVFCGDYTDGTKQYNYIHVDNSWRLGNQTVHTALVNNGGELYFYWNNKRRNIFGTDLGTWGTHVEFCLGQTVLLNNNGFIWPADSKVRAIHVSKIARYTDAAFTYVDTNSWQPDANTVSLIQFKV